MRSREEIERSVDNNSGDRVLMDILIEVALDIRDLLQKSPPKAPDDLCFGEPCRHDGTTKCALITANHEPVPPVRDELFDEAKALAQSWGKGSTVTAIHIQSGLSEQISYARASALMDQLEEAGIVIKDLGAVRRRVA